MEKEKQIKKFDKQADKYARKRKRQAENKWRKRLCTNAKGETLEVAVGAGMNLSYYPKSIKLTFK